MDGAARVLPTHIIAVGGVAVNEKGEILLVKDNRSGWVFPGGIVEAGENLTDAVKREILEETGMDVEVGELFCISSNTGRHPGYNGVKEVPTKLMLDFRCTVEGGTLRASDENSESAFFPKERAIGMIQSPAIRERFQAFLEYAGRPTYLEYVTYPAFRRKLKRQV